MKKIRLGVNIDHVATVRNARGEEYPSPLKAALLAEKNGADYIGIGPIFSTLSKKNLDPLLGIEKASYINNSCNCPSFIIGGISLNNIKQVKNIGSRGFCVLNSINISKNPEKIIKLLQEEWESIDF